MVQLGAITFVGLLAIVGLWFWVGWLESRDLERDRKVAEALEEPENTLKKSIDSL